MRPASEDIRDILVTELGYVVGTTLHRGKQPANHDSCVTIYDTGNVPVLDLCKEVNSYPSVQLKVRDINYSQAYTAAEAIVNNLNGRSNEVISGIHYTSIMVANGPELIDYDHKNRVNFIINLNIQRRIE